MQLLKVSTYATVKHYIDGKRVSEKAYLYYLERGMRDGSYSCSTAQYEAGPLSKAKHYCIVRGDYVPLHLIGRLPLQPGVLSVQYHRKPTKGEIRFGHGAIHYRDFPTEEIVYKGTRIARKWVKAKDDGLRYYR